MLINLVFYLSDKKTASVDGCTCIGKGHQRRLRPELLCEFELYDVGLGRADGGSSVARGECDGDTGQA